MSDQTKQKQPVQSPSCYCRTLNEDPLVIPASEVRDRGQLLNRHELQTRG